jgi:hypothetical protein
MPRNCVRESENASKLRQSVSKCHEIAPERQQMPWHCKNKRINLFWLSFFVANYAESRLSQGNLNEPDVAYIFWLSTYINQYTHYI